MRDDRGRLQDILDAIKQIERYAKRGRRVFEEDELVHTWMIHHIQPALFMTVRGEIAEPRRETSAWSPEAPMRTRAVR